MQTLDFSEISRTFTCEEDKELNITQRIYKYKIASQEIMIGMLTYHQQNINAGMVPKIDTLIAYLVRIADLCNVTEQLQIAYEIPPTTDLQIQSELLHRSAIRLGLVKAALYYRMERTFTHCTLADEISCVISLLVSLKFIFKTINS